MEVQSAFSSGLQGFQNATELAYEAASNIVKQTTSNSETSTIDLGANSQSLSFAPPNNIVSINQSLVDLKVAEHQAKAASAVIRTADETLGTLIDVSV